MVSKLEFWSRLRSGSQKFGLDFDLSLKSLVTVLFSVSDVQSQLTSRLVAHFRVEVRESKSCMDCREVSLHHTDAAWLLCRQTAVGGRAATGA